MTVISSEDAKHLGVKILSGNITQRFNTAINKCCIEGKSHNCDYAE
jgi:hypothetical protein